MDTLGSFVGVECCGVTRDSRYCCDCGKQLKQPHPFEPIIEYFKSRIEEVFDAMKEQTELIVQREAEGNTKVVKRLTTLRRKNQDRIDYWRDWVGVLEERMKS